MSKPRAPVTDWTTDYDIFDAHYVHDPTPIWRDLRARCPIARTERWGGSWLVTRYSDVQKMVRMVPALSSRDPVVVAAPEAIREDVRQYGINSPPITSDPPDHTALRRMLLPFFTPKAVERYRAHTRAVCDALIDGFIDDGCCDAAADYAQQIPGRVVANLLGVDAGRAEEFVQWVRGALEIGLTDSDERIRSRRNILAFLHELIAERKQRPGDDLVSGLLASTLDGKPPPDPVVLGISNLVLVAGIDTTWSSIGAALLHFATHADDRRRLAADPALFPTAIEELLRAYSPVTMARKVTQPVSIGDVTFSPGEKVLLSFPAANRDPDAFERADEVVLDRERNRHIAFGVGIHRCAGSNLARMEMDVALRAWFERIPEFELTDASGVTWAGGQVRGPRHLPVRFPSARVTKV